MAEAVDSGAEETARVDKATEAEEEPAPETAAEATEGAEAPPEEVDWGAPAADCWAEAARSTAAERRFGT